jgi:prepilin-type N-terminal cleavage/methylation domain-containing protein/prepilin-type processing-associated H-X9-DG protein
VKQRGFTLIELLVVIAIIAILAAILFPVFASARELALVQYEQDFDETVIPPAIGTSGGYDWMDLLLPYYKDTRILVCPDVPTNRIFCTTQGLPMSAWASDTCPAGKYEATYAINNTYWSTASQWVFQNPPIVMSSLESPSMTIFAGDAMAWGSGNNYQVSGVSIQNIDNMQAIGWGGAYNGSGQGQWVARHTGGVNFIFFDGHAKLMMMGPLFTKGANGYYEYFSRTQSF